MYAWHDFYLHTNCSKRIKFAHSKEKLLTKIKFAPSKNLLKKFAHSRNLLTEFARSIEKLLTMKNLAGSDGSTRWLNVSYQANRSTAGAHHSTVSVVTAGTCWAGPSRALGTFLRRGFSDFWYHLRVSDRWYHVSTPNIRVGSNIISVSWYHFMIPFLTPLQKSITWYQLIF